MVLSAATISATLTRNTAPQASQVTSASVASLTQCPRCHKQRKAGSKFCNGCGLRYDEKSVTAATNAQTQVAKSTSSLKAGDLLSNKYRITREIGEGGMGAVFLAEDQLLKRPV